MQKKSKGVYFLTLMLALAFVIVACTPKAQQQAADTLTETGPSVTVSDQQVFQGMVTVAEVVSNGAGWMVIHADDGAGKPGAVIGQTAVSDGVNKNVVVKIDESQATAKLFAMLHIDAGELNTYEFPGADTPEKVNNSIVVKPFNVTGIDAEAMIDDDTSLKVPAPGVDPDEIDEMIVNDGGDAIEEGDNTVVEQPAKIFNVGGVNFTFSQTEIRVKKGDTVTINFTSNGGFHDSGVDEFSARTERVNSGESSSVTFVADQTGTFEYYCSVGSHRALGMVGQLIVE